MSEANVRRAVSNAQVIDPSVSSVSTLVGRFQDFLMLPEATTSVPDLPIELLSEGLQRWVEDVAERMQIPAACIAGPAMVGAGAVLGTKVVIQPKAEDTGWQVVPNLWGGSWRHPVSSRQPPSRKP